MIAEQASRSGTVGVVVIGRNEGARLELCLRSILPHTGWVVYADSASTDGSAERAESLGARVVRLDDTAPHTAARGRSEGLAELLRAHPSCAYVQFVDGDCVLDSDWLQRGASFLDTHPKAAVVCGRRREMRPAASPYIRLCDDEWNTPVGQAEACGGDAMMRIEALQKVGGYRRELRAGEEPELCSRLRADGWEVWRIDAPMTEHDAAILQFGQWWKRALRGGFGYAQVHRATSTHPAPLYARQLQSALFWVAGVPLLAVLAALLTGRAAFLLAPLLLWALQIARMAMRRGPGTLWSWQSATLIMIAKIPELIGALRYHLHREKSAALEYKGAA